MSRDFAKPIILIGTGGHAEATLDVINTVRHLQVSGLIDEDLEPGSKRLDLPILGKLERIGEYVASHRFVIAVGKVGKSAVRREIAEECRRQGGELQTVISPHAYVSPTATIGEGTVVFHHAMVNAGAVVGRNCILNTKSLVEHDSRIGDHSHISTGAIVNGVCQVGENVFLGSGAILHHQVVIDDNGVVGAGVVIKSEK